MLVSSFWSITSLLLIPATIAIKCSAINRTPQLQPPTYLNNHTPSSRKDFEDHDQKQVYLNNSIPSVCDEAARIVTYNIHFHYDLYKASVNTANVEKDLRKIDPTVVIFQEVTPNGNLRKGFDAMLDSVGLKYRIFASTNNHVLGNMIASRYPLTNLGSLDLGHERVVFAAGLELGTTKLAVVGTHLEVGKHNQPQKASQIRTKQAEQILRFIQNTVQPNYPNYILGGDMNAQWVSNEIQVYNTAGTMRESFNVIRSQNPNAKHPQYTCWSGTTIDFLFISNALSSKALGAYSYHNVATSDHLPIMVDLLVGEKKPDGVLGGPKNNAPPAPAPAKYNKTPENVEKKNNKTPEKEAEKKETNETEKWSLRTKVILWCGIGAASIITISVVVYFVFFRKP